MISKKFYVELGKLFYAIAAADGKIRPQEVQSLKKLIREDLVPMEDGHDKFGTDNAYLAEFEFDVLVDKGVRPEAAYKSFLMYVKENDKHIDSNMRTKAVTIAEKIADAYKGINEKEKKMLEDLKHHLHIS
jgi:uncharacterized tellurite resistance protein B-like protein